MLSVAPPVPAVAPKPIPEPVIAKVPTPAAPAAKPAPLGVQPAAPAAPVAAPGLPTAPGLPPAAPGTTTLPPIPSARPPQTVTALSSVSSNKLPAGAGAPAPAPAAPVKPPTDVEYAKPKKSVFKFLPYIIGGLLMVLVAAFGVMWFLNRDGGSSTNGGSSSGTQNANGGSSGTAGTGGSTSGQQVVLQYWGLWEPSETMQQIISDYQKTAPGVSVQYVKQSHKDYRTRLQNAIASGNGPDLFRFHAAWVPMLKNELAPLPSAVISSSEYQQTFYPVASEQLQINGTPVGIPLMYEGLELFYNVDIFNTAVVQPPTTWSETQELAKRLTVSEGGVVRRAGIAMGNATNVEHFSDIVALLMLQNGADFTKPNSPETRDALLFYTKFMRDSVWSDSLPNSSVAFARGDVAMIFAPSWRAHEIKQMNPTLNFATVTVPQLSADDKVAWANYWAEGVSVKGKHQKEAWQFLKYLSSKEVQQKLYSEQAKTRSFGEIYSRIDAADTLAADKIVGAFVIDAPKAKGWHMSSATHDKGINDEIIAYYETAITALAAGGSTDEVLETLDAGVKQVLQKYGVAAAAAN